MFTVKALLVALLCLVLIGCGDEKRAVETETTCGIIKGVVMINPSPYTITEVYGSALEGSPYVRVQLIGQSNTCDYLVGTDFGSIGGGVYRAGFTLGAYDCNAGAPVSLQGVRGGEYSISFTNGYFDAVQGRIPLKTVLLSKVDNASITVQAAKTTEIGLVLLRPQ
jgi:hypothetical protein